MNRNFIHLLFLLILAYGCNSVPEVQNVETSFDFNKEWQFVKDMDTTITVRLFEADDASLAWQDIRLPHTANIEPLVIEDPQWQGYSFYRKFFTANKEDEGKYIALKFDGAMHEAEVLLNGEQVFYHAGGYLPFVVNISDQVRFGEENALLVRLNNLDNPEIPPGKPMATLDFNYYGGIYRDVHLIKKDPLRISDPIEADRVGAGGVFVSYENVSEEQATVVVQADLENGRSESAKALLQIVLEDSKGKRIISEEAELEVQSGSNAIHTEKITVENPALWSPDKPNLYTLTVQLLEEGTLLDSREQNIGIRTFGFDEENQFTLNGKRIYLRGTNRHQDYPYIGYALSDNAQYRDAYKIKEAGFNFIRTAHYPPDPSFLKACDELGLLFMDAIPGWQFYRDGIFADRSLQNIREVIRRDRNHPSIIIWEASLNESGMPKEFMTRADEIVKEELPVSDVYSSGWMDFAYDIFIPARQHSRPPEYWSEYSKDKPTFIAEYGDWEYYAQNAGFNQTAYENLKEEERTSRQLREAGQKRLAQQALNFQEAHNSNLNGPSFGDANWVMFDYNRGYAPDIESSGIRDIFRIPKFAHYFYRSQVDPAVGDSSADFNKPIVYIANFWSDPEFTEVRVFSNAEEVALSLNGEEIFRQTPDSNRVSTNLKHPPFTFKMDSFEPGILKAQAYIGGQVVATHERQTPREPTSIDLKADISGKEIQSGVNDVVFVYARITDENGTVVHNATNEIRFGIEGDAKLVGQNPISAEAGVATILVRIGESAGSVTISATADDLKNGELELESKE